MKYKVVEKFISINGEGISSGQLAVFIRFAGCNLDCSYCDTKWANEKDVEYDLMSGKEIYDYIQSTGIKNITLTGGEPLIQEGMLALINLLSTHKKNFIEIETNGSVDISKFIPTEDKLIRFTMDYKLGSSDMEEKMNMDNFNYLRNWDVIKFVVGSMSDLKRAKSIINKHHLIDKANVYISPVFGEIDRNDIVEFMKENKMNKATLQIQLHKVIWNPKKRGV